jgi:hypothetical protein
VNILSVDLAHTSYANLGIILLEEDRDVFSVRRLYPGDLGLGGPPSPGFLATQLAAACQSLSAPILLLDGPQGWKHPENGLAHSRICERKLNTPGKTGLPGSAKPANYLPFMAFSIEVFAVLVAAGFELWTDHVAPLLVVESFPLSAWRQLGLAPLPAKSKARAEDLARATEDLLRLFPLKLHGKLSHDELQALVAALAGVPLARRCHTGYAVVGAPPTRVDDTWREGFIVNPTRDALRPCAEGSA